MLRQDRVLLSITAGFALFNCSAGMVRVANPWLAQYKLPGGAHTLGLLLSSYSGAQLVGSLIAGTLKPSDRQMRRIGILQIFAGGSLFLLLFDRLPFIVAGLILCGGFSSPMAVSSQVIRVMRIPTELRGRTMTLMRTLMNGAIPIGSLVAAPLLARGSYHLLVWLMTVTAAIPGVAIALSYRGMSIGAQVTGAPGLESQPGNTEQTMTVDEALSSVPVHVPAVD